MGPVGSDLRGEHSQLQGSLSQACTLSLHQDKLSKMEDGQALAGEQREMPPLVNSRLGPTSLFYLNDIVWR
uniref:Uncharacterized protein n=1 Tax=Knipowitschia caucasica TaxID=637954 RepID=A0AAV2K1H6_KNICA